MSPTKEQIAYEDTCTSTTEGSNAKAQLYAARGENNPPIKYRPGADVGTGCLLLHFPSGSEQYLLLVSWVQAGLRNLTL